MDASCSTCALQVLPKDVQYSHRSTNCGSKSGPWVNLSLSVCYCSARVRHPEEQTMPVVGLCRLSWKPHVNPVMVPRIWPQPRTPCTGTLCVKRVAPRHCLLVLPWHLCHHCHQVPPAVRSKKDTEPARLTPCHGTLHNGIWVQSFCIGRLIL